MLCNISPLSASIIAALTPSAVFFSSRTQCRKRLFRGGQGGQHRASGNSRHGIGFPVAKSLPRLRFCRAFGYFVADGKAAACDFCSFVQVLFVTMTQVAFAASHPIRGVKETRVDGAIDGRAADGMLAVFMAQSVLDLLRRPLLLKEFLFNQRIELRVIALAPTSANFALLLVIRLRPNGVIPVFVKVFFCGSLHGIPMGPAINPRQAQITINHNMTFSTLHFSACLIPCAPENPFHNQKVLP